MYTDDFTYKASRASVVNRLMNGNFLSLPRQYTSKDNGETIVGPVGITKVRRTLYRYKETKSISGSTLEKETIPGFHVPSEPDPENYIAYWDVWGTEGVVNFEKWGRSLDGGNRVDIEFTDSGIIQFRQTIESFEKFLGKPISLALSGYERSKDVKVWMEVDCGTEILKSRSFFSRYFGPYRRMIDVFEEVPLNASKFEICLKMEGGKGSSLGISGAMLAMGLYTVDLPYSDNPSDKILPSGSVILFAGEVCPPGYRSLVEDDTYLFVHLGDPNAVLGNYGVPEGGTLDESTVFPSTRKVFGANRHNHTTEALGLGLSMELQPAALEEDVTDFITPRVESQSTPPGLVALVDGQDEVYEGIRDKILPDTHSHIIRIAEESVEPPHIRLRICEKI